MAAFLAAVPLSSVSSAGAARFEGFSSRGRPAQQTLLQAQRPHSAVADAFGIGALVAAGANRLSGGARVRPARSGGARRRSCLHAFENELGVQPPLGFWDPMGLCDDGEAAYRRRRSVELKHGRISMLACMGFMTPEITGKWPGFLSPSLNLKFADVPSGLDALKVVPTLGWAQILVWFGLVEYTGGFDDYQPGGTPGDYGWKVLTSDDEEERRRKLNAELANGRLAMVAIMAMLFQNGLAKTTGPEMWIPPQLLQLLPK